MPDDPDAVFDVAVAVGVVAGVADEQCTRRYLVPVDIYMSFAAAATRSLSG
ncbi:hypothetical protein [Streptomyces sp. NPDC059455]|uniref:hypothetical protein n=1 Tax=Streptomyces sp. NPDC059455 TaxID=3346837 RepID=UPI0036C1FD06